MQGAGECGLVGPARFGEHGPRRCHRSIQRPARGGGFCRPPRGL